ncbi:hypothetical protein [Blastomonas aquatica]|uniref:Uncharacterized protein n=1 Tax=Blastomonas aquatica TaxID=1510276 RepID=A0ABQ1IWN3_9SPHN|nr:hypothetical protein [Blastomonas aquatica]GGB54389.1 hypothetical protein GCM10010833_06350 [Blastomonas aquatica]
MYQAHEIERWIADVEAATAKRIDSVVTKLRTEPAVRGQVLARPDAKERVFSALLTGDFEYLRSREANWTSWVEGDPPYLLLLMHEGVVVDLGHPRFGRAGFLQTFGCSPEQLAMLVRHRPYDRPGPLFINIRDDDIEGYCQPDRLGIVGPILAMTGEFPERFYRLHLIRRAAFRIFGIDYDEMERFGRHKASRFQPPASSAYRDEDLKLITRSAEWPNVNQLGSRIGYYLIAKQLWGEEAADPLIDTWIGGSADPIDFSQSSADDLTIPFSRLYVRHHTFTAPLTGALGAQYTMRAREANAIFQVFGGTDSVSDPEPIKKVARRKSAGGHIGIATWMFEQISGMDGDAVNISQSPLRRLPEDDEWRQFLGRVDRNRLDVVAHAAANVSALEKALERLEPRLKNGVLEPHEEAELVRVAISAGSRGGFRGLSFLCAGAEAASAGGAGVLCKSVVEALNILVKFTEAVPAFDSSREKLAQYVNSFCAKRIAGTLITRFEGQMDRPSRLN